MEARGVPGLYFIGEVVDVTGWLGGYNFQWAWSSGWAAGQAAVSVQCRQPRMFGRRFGPELDEIRRQTRSGSALARWSNAIRLAISAGISASGIMFGPSDGRAVGVLVGLDEDPAMPRLTAARAMTGANSRWPPEAVALARRAAAPNGWHP